MVCVANDSWLKKIFYLVILRVCRLTERLLSYSLNPFQMVLFRSINFMTLDMCHKYAWEMTNDKHASSIVSRIKKIMKIGGSFSLYNMYYANHFEHGPRKYCSILWFAINFEIELT